MIILYSKHVVNPFCVEYVDDNRAFRKEILANYLVGFRNLTGATQITNLQFLKDKGIAIIDPINGIVTNQGSYATGYTGFVAQSGLTLTSPLVTTPTGYTFVTSASTDNALANNAATATTDGGNNIYIGYSGASVSTLTWFNAIRATSFSGLGITVSGQSSSTFINSGATITLTLSANTFSTNVANTLFVGDNVKRSDYIIASAFSATTAFNNLNTLVNV